SWPASKTAVNLPQSGAAFAHLPRTVVYVPPFGLPADLGRSCTPLPGDIQACSALFLEYFSLRSNRLAGCLFVDGVVFLFCRWRIF
ncbi:MAG: hypothetical protein ACK6EB_06420, partial [Planctomyces sp.]